MCLCCCRKNLVVSGRRYKFRIECMFGRSKCTGCRQCGTGATLFVGIVEGVCTRGSVSVVVPSVGIAGILEDALMGAVVDGKV